MRQVTFSYPTETAVEICATQTTTVATSALLINGGLSNISQLNNPGYIPIAVLPGIQRSVQISSTGNISTSTFTISGYDLRATGLLSTTVAGPTGFLIPTHTTIEFNQVTSVVVGTIASSTFTIGVGATGSSNWVQGDTFKNPFNMTVVVVTGTSQPVTIQDTPNNPNFTSSPTVFNHATLVTVTVNQESNYAFPVAFTRAVFTASAVAAATSSATTAASVYFIQTG